MRDEHIVNAWLTHHAAVIFFYVFPVTGLAFGHPFHRGLQAARPRVLPLGVRDPFHVFLPVAVTKGVERGLRLFVFL